MSAASLSPQAIFYMSLLALQFGLQPILSKRFTPPTVSKLSVIIVQESMKFILAFSMLLASGNLQTVLKGRQLSNNQSYYLVMEPTDLKKTFFGFENLKL